MKKTFFALFCFVTFMVATAVPSFALTVGNAIYDDIDFIEDEAVFKKFDDELTKLSEDNDFGVFIFTRSNTGEYADVPFADFPLTVLEDYSQFYSVAPDRGVIIVTDNVEAVINIFSYGDVDDVLTEAYHERFTADFLMYENMGDPEMAFQSVVDAATDMFSGEPAFSIDPAEISPVIDNANIFTDAEEAILLAKIEEIRTEYDFDVTLATVTTLNGMDVIPYADTFPYLDMTRDGVVFVQYPAGREYAISARGTGMEAYNENAHTYAGDTVVSHLADNNHFDAHYAFLETVEDIMKSYEMGIPFVDLSGFTLIFIIGVGLGVASSVAYCVNLVKGMNTVTKQRAATNYMRRGSLFFRHCNDQFLYERTTKRARQQSSSGGGRSGGGGGRGSFSSGSRSSSGGRY